VEIRQTRGGLLVAEETAAPASIREALKKIHPDLILGQEVDSAWSEWVWKVLFRNGDRPAIWLFDWRENLEDPRSRPRPLSFGIVDHAASLQRGSRRPVIDPLQANDKLAERLANASELEALEIAAEVRARHRRRSPVHRSQGLRRARDRQRARGENV
jgi:hypothetical protein